MRYKDISKPLRVFMGYWEGLRKVGFSSSDIFFHISEHPLPTRKNEKWIFCSLIQGEKKLAIECGKLLVTEEQAFDEYRSMSDKMNTGQINQMTLDRIWQESRAHKRAFEFVTFLAANGFIVDESLIRRLLN